MKLDSLSNQIYIVAFNEAKLQSHEFVTPEHFLYATAMFDVGKNIIEESGGGVKGITSEIQGYFDEYLAKTSPETQPVESMMFLKMIEIASRLAENSGRQEITLGGLLYAIFSLPESHAVYIMKKNGMDLLRLQRSVSHGVASSINARHHASGQRSAMQSGQDERKPKSAAELLKTYTINLTSKAREGKLDPLVGREEIIERTFQVLCRRLKNNPIHVGDSGVGKTAIVEGLAQCIVSGKAPRHLQNADIFYLDMGGVVAGTKYRGDFEERLIAILDACMSTPNPIVYIDEIHNIIGAGSVNGGVMDAAGILKPYLQKGELKFIGSTTYDDYKKHFEKDGALSRRFQSIEVPEPSVSETEMILKGIKHKYEKWHGVSYNQNVIALISRLSGKFLTDRRLPDKAIDVMDETGAFLRIKHPDKKTIRVTARDVEHTIALMAKVPENSVSENETELLKTLSGRIKQGVFGQDPAVDAVTNAIIASRAGLSEGDKPVASLLFVGPTGVGKTEIAKQLARCLNIQLTRFDMSEYQEGHAVAKLIGSPPGYVGYNEGGLLTDSIRKTPHTVLLLDEIEKAHTDILNILLQVMDYGVLTDSAGKKADFRNVILIMTSNAGARELGRRMIGYDDRRFASDSIDKEVDRVFSPEFRNRLDEIIVFNHIDEKMAMQITDKAINALRGRLEPKGLRLEIDAEAAEWIASKGLSRQYGAREIIRIVNRELRRQLADIILFADKGKLLKVSLCEGELKILS